VYRPPQDFDRIRPIVQNSDILVFDHGLHWNPGQGGEFQEAMEQLLSSGAKSSNPVQSLQQTDTMEDKQRADNQTAESMEVQIPPGSLLKLVAWRHNTIISLVVFIARDKSRGRVDVCLVGQMKNFDYPFGRKQVSMQIIPCWTRSMLSF
jgi:hypothetical protein